MRLGIIYSSKILSDFLAIMVWRDLRLRAEGTANMGPSSLA
jgi:hypothetical protein